MTGNMIAGHFLRTINGHSINNSSIYYSLIYYSATFSNSLFFAPYFNCCDGLVGYFPLSLFLLCLHLLVSALLYLL